MPGEDLPHVSHYYTAAASVLPQERRDRRRQELGGGGGARSLSRRRARDDRPSPRRDRRFHQVLGEARHRQPHQGRLDRRALQHARRRDPSDQRRRRTIRTASREIPAGRGVPADWLRRGHALLRARRHQDRRRNVRPGLRRANVRDQRPGHLYRRRDGGGGRAAGSSSRTAASTASR